MTNEDLLDICKYQTNSEAVAKFEDAFLRIARACYNKGFFDGEHPRIEELYKRDQRISQLENLMKGNQYANT